MGIWRARTASVLLCLMTTNRISGPGLSRPGAIHVEGNGRLRGHGGLPLRAG